MSYRAVLLTKKGDPDALKTVVLPDPDLRPGEVRLRVRASGVGGTDLTMRRGSYVFAPPLPFVPGYEVIGEVLEVGAAVTGFGIGQRAAALVVHGGNAERIVVRASELVPVPPGVDDAEAAALVLNYVTAYQAIHRTAKVQPGDAVLVTGANGGVGSAMVELLRLHGATVIGAASPAVHDPVRALGATPVDSRAPALSSRVRELAPGGVAAALDNLGGRFPGECVRAVRRGGSVVGVGFSAATNARGEPSRLATLRGLAALFLLAPASGRRGRFYGITYEYRKNPRPFREDLPRLFELLAERRIAPRIHARLPLLEVRRAHELLERGGITGKIVLTAS
jgi:NADPH:quinone reductase-like Zn-dependent oxidoreductase